MSDFWSAPATVGVLYPVAVLAVAGLATRVPKIGPPLTSGIKRAGKALTSIRVTTKDRIERRVEEARPPEDAIVVVPSDFDDFTREQLESSAAVNAQAAKGWLLNLVRKGRETGIEVLSRKREAAAAAGRHRDEVENLEVAVSDAEHNAHLFQVAAESSRKENVDLKIQVNDLVGTEDQVRNLREQVQVLDRRATAAEEQLAHMWDVEDLPPEDPPPLPRWRLVDPASNEPRWGLTNLVPRSVTRRVRLESNDTYFRINDAAYWDVVDGDSTVFFHGQLTQEGIESGARIVVEWLDQDGDRHQHSLDIEVELDPWGNPI